MWLTPLLAASTASSSLRRRLVCTSSASSQTSAARLFSRLHSLELMEAQNQAELVRAQNATIAGLSAANTALHTTATQMQTQMDALKETNTTLQGQVRAYVSMQAPLEAPRETDAELQDQVRAHEATIKTQGTRIDELCETNIALQKQVDERKADVQSWQERSSFWQSYYCKYNEWYTESRTDHQKAKDRCDESEKRNAAQQKQIGALRTEIFGLKKALDQQSAHVKHAVADISGSGNGALPEQHLSEHSNARAQRDDASMAHDDEHIDDDDERMSARDSSATSSAHHEKPTASSKDIALRAQKRKYGAFADDAFGDDNSSSDEERPARRMTPMDRDRGLPLSSPSANSDARPSESDSSLRNPDYSSSSEEDSDDPASCSSTLDAATLLAENNVSDSASVSSDDEPARSHAWKAETRNRFIQA
jgi:uncharacterized coiled-coil protein SlyX